MSTRHLQLRHFTSSIFKRCPYVNSVSVAAPELDEVVQDAIAKDIMKPRKHPGVMKVGSCSIPDQIVKAIKVVAEDHPVKSILGDARHLANYLFSRHYPWEDEDLEEKQNKYKDQVIKKLGTLGADSSEETVKHYRQMVNSSVEQLMAKHKYNWSPLNLDEYSCLVYLFTRAAPNYAATVRVFNEIAKLCPDYRPTSLFDFGSGIGSVSWAAKHYWANCLKEFVNIDSSSSMNELSETLLCGGKRKGDSPRGVYYRAFLPAQHRPYSLVVSAHSLLEMPSRESRLNLLLNLWAKTQDFLVILEQGTKPGFKVVVEAREFILSLRNNNSVAHIFAPCPHDQACPRLARGLYPCHTQVGYSDMAIGKKESIKKELISYVIIRKDERREEGDRWPRVVRPILRRHNHAICRLCTHHGDLREIIFTPKKHGKVLYKCAKVTNWGDRLPVKLPPPSQDNCQPDLGQEEPEADDGDLETVKQHPELRC